MKRAWLYQRMRADAALTDIFGDRMFQGESLDSAPKTKPFLIYRMGNTSPDNDLRKAGRRQYCTIYLHDQAKPGDYAKIDLGLAALIDCLTTAPPSPEDNIMEVHWLETSADFDDREMGTILRYARFQFILSHW